eukprot:UN20392
MLYLISRPVLHFLHNQFEIDQISLHNGDYLEIPSPCVYYLQLILLLEVYLLYIHTPQLDEFCILLKLHLYYQTLLPSVRPSVFYI